MFIVTGVSRGIGESLALALLNRGDQVLGIGRSHRIEHPRFSFISCDLRQKEEILALPIEFLKESVTLINNAGILGQIGRISQADDLEEEQVFAVNGLAPIHLTRLIYSKVEDKNNFTLVNISSGAANRAIPSWAAYCASKAALNRWTETFLLEEEELGRHPKVYAVAPGVVDTDMQARIRETDSSAFSAVQNFISLKENDQLFTSERAAELLLNLLEKPYAGQVCVDLRQQ